MSTYDKKNGDQTITGKDGKIVTNIGAGKSKTPTSRVTLKSEDAPKDTLTSLIPDAHSKFQAFKEEKKTIRENKLKNIEKNEAQQEYLLAVREGIVKKMDSDTITIKDFIIQFHDEGSLSDYVLLHNNLDGDEYILDLDKTIKSIITPLNNIVNSESLGSYEHYTNGHEPLIYSKEIVKGEIKEDSKEESRGFIKGDDQSRVSGSKGIQAKYETWIEPKYRGLGLEVKVINTAIEKKILATKATIYKDHFTEGVFQAIVWEGNEALAINLLNEGWGPVLPSIDEVLEYDTQHFHLFSKLVKF